MSLAGLARVKQFSWEQVAEKTYEMYQQVMKTNPESVRHSNVELAA